MAFDPTVHISPRTHLFRAFDIIVRNVHSSSIGDLPIDDDDFPVITAENMVDPWEADRVELINLNAFFP